MFTSDCASWRSLVRLEILPRQTPFGGIRCVANLSWEPYHINSNDSSFELQVSNETKHDIYRVAVLLRFFNSINSTQLI